MGALAPGAIIGNCRVEGVVGQGGMGVVYRARQLDLDREVALKVVAPALTGDPEARARFLAEARTAAAVDHPGVVPVHAAGEVDGAAYLVMRFVRGDDLRTLVRRDGPLPPDRAALVTERLGEALDAIHRAGYVHRDVKPQNVLLDEDGHVYLSDFGVAKALAATHGETVTDHWVGTLDYVAPEQIRGQRVDARADVYALGGVLHYMLTGAVPFPRESDEARLWAHLHERPPRPSELAPLVPAAFDAVVASAMDKDRTRRYASAGALGRAALAAAHGEAPTAVMHRHRRHRSARLWPAALALTAAAAGAAVLLFPRGGDPPRAAQDRSPGPGPTATSTAEPSRPVAGPTWDNVGDRPRDIALAAGGVFVISHSRSELVWIDARTGARKDAEPIGSGASDIEPDGDGLWVTLEPGRVVHVDGGTGAVDPGFPVEPRARLVVANADGLWVATESKLDDSDHVFEYSRSGTLVRDITVDDDITALAAGGGFVWMATGDRRLWKIGRGPPRPVATLRAPAWQLSFGAGKLWASEPDRDAIQRIDPRTGRPASDFLRGADQIAVWRGRAFIAQSVSDRVTVRGRERFSIPMPEGPFAVTAGLGHVWVACIESNKVVRIDWQE